jgi:hypothetical protein
MVDKFFTWLKIVQMEPNKICRESFNYINPS